MLDEPVQFRLSESQPHKLTSWKNEPDLLALKSDLEAARPSQQSQMSKIQVWNDLMYIRGKAKPPKVKGHSQVQPKLVRRQAEWRYSALTEPFLGSNKLFQVKPVTYEDVPAAKQNELVINWQFRTKLNKVKLIDDMVRSTVDEGTSILRLGWKRNTIKVKREVPTFDHIAIDSQEQLEAFQQMIAMKESDPRGFEDQADDATKAALDLYEETGEATLAQQTGTAMVTEEKVLENRPTVEVLNPNNVYIDPSCQGDIEKALFIVYSFETNRAELKKEPDRYKNLDKIDWEGNTPLSQPDHETTTPDDFRFNDQSRKKVVAYEYWGFYDCEGDGKLVPIVATWIGSTIIRMEENPFPDEKLPFVVIPYLPVKRDLYGEPDAELLEDNQKIIGAVVRGAIDLLGRSANAQRGFQKGMLDPLNRRRYDNGQDYEFNPNSHPQQGVIEHKYPELPQSVMLMMGMQNQEAEALTGVKSFSGGISGESYGEVAAGIKGVLDAASKREMAILRRMAMGMSQVGTKIMSMNAAFLSEKEVIRITNTEFVEIKREDLQGNFDMEVDISTAEVDNAKSQDLAFMLQTMGPNGDPKISMMILSEIAYLKRMPALAKTLAEYQPQPDPILEQMKKAELDKLLKEIQKMDSEIAFNNARAQEAMSKKDKNDLDFVEQESGTKHERDLQYQRAQSEGNQALEITKGLLKPKKKDEKAPDIEAAIGFNAISGKLAQARDQRPDPRPVAPPVTPPMAAPPVMAPAPMDPALGSGMPVSPMP